MVRKFELSRHRRAHVWLDETPLFEFRPTSTMNRMLKPKVSVNAARHIAAVELYIPHGAKVSYALLGAELVEADVDGLEVQVLVNKTGAPYRASLASKLDEVKVGLPDEYASAVLGGIEKIAESSGAPTRAALWFRWAAHGVVGSSPSVFEQASAIVVRLLTLQADALDEHIRAFLG